MGIRRMMCRVMIVTFVRFLMGMNLMGSLMPRGLCLSMRIRKNQRFVIIRLRKLSVRLAGPCAFLIAEITTLHRALNMVMVAVLR